MYNNYAYWVGSSVYYYQCVQQLCLFGKPISLLLYCRYNNYAYWVSLSVYCYLVCTTIMPTGLVHQFTVILQVQQLCLLGKSFSLLLYCMYNNYAYWVSPSIYCYIACTTIMPTGLVLPFTVILCVQQLCLLG